jgi:hypothetical protein
VYITMFLSIQLFIDTVARFLFLWLKLLQTPMYISLYVHYFKIPWINIRARVAGS